MLSIRNFALTGIATLNMLKEGASRRNFDVSSYVAKSFGAYHDGKFDQWVLRFKAEAAYELATYQFHPSQTVTVLPSGEVEVTFECESIREVAYECFRWSGQLVAAGPRALQDMIREISTGLEQACGST